MNIDLTGQIVVETCDGGILGRRQEQLERRIAELSPYGNIIGIECNALEKDDYPRMANLGYPLTGRLKVMPKKTDYKQASHEYLMNIEQDILNSYFKSCSPKKR